MAKYRHMSLSASLISANHTEMRDDTYFLSLMQWYWFLDFTSICIDYIHTFIVLCEYLNVLYSHIYSAIFFFGDCKYAFIYDSHFPRVGRYILCLV